MDMRNPHSVLWVSAATLFLVAPWGFRQGFREALLTMNKSRGALALAIGLLLGPSWQAQDSWRGGCIQRCLAQPQLGDPEVQRQEVVSLEREAAHAILLGNGTFFQRVFSDDFEGTLSHGQRINRDQWIETIHSHHVKRESFIATDIQVREFQETALST